MESQKNNKTNSTASSSKKALPIVAVALLLVCAAVVMFVNGNKTDEQPTSELPSDASTIIAQGESLVIPISEITEEVTFYPFTVDGEDMEVLAVRASDGTIRTAFNTCQSCYTSGAGFYRFEEGKLICNNCGFHFSPDQVQVASGGCNPWPIFDDDKTTSDDSILISYDFLSASKEIFANWKSSVT